MKLFLRYIQQMKGWISIILFSFLVQVVVYYLYDIPLQCILYTEGLVLILYCTYGIYHYFKFKRNYEILKNLQDVEVASIFEYPKCTTLIEEQYQEILHHLQEYISTLTFKDKKKYEDMIDYYTLWVHQIKTPIASMKLKLQSEDTEFSRNVERDLFRIEQYTEMVLTYLRLDSSSTDYIFKKQDIDILIKNVLHKLSKDFIEKKLSLKYSETQLHVVTDAKWISFVFEQVLTNALKYTKEGSISIYAENEDTLCIRDTGIGIQKEDLPRIFENGFTGFNGRQDKQATGIGLYLCKRICNNLHHEIIITSKVSEGTLVKIRFLQNCKK